MVAGSSPSTYNDPSERQEAWTPVDRGGEKWSDAGYIKGRTKTDLEKYLSDNSIKLNKIIGKEQNWKKYCSIHVRNAN